MNQFKAGFFQTDITPPLHVPCAGSWTDVAVTGYLEPLKANAVVLDDGQSKAAIVSLELCGACETLTNDIRREIERRCGIPEDNVLVHTTHVHSGPKTTDDPNDHYSQNMKMQAVTAVWMAGKRLKDVKIGVGRATNEIFTHNRRLTAPNGEIAMNWFAPEDVSDCVENTDARDTDVFALRFEDMAGNVVGFIINYSNHNNARGGTVINPDFGGYIGQCLRAAYGGDVVTVLLLGACGDVNWVDYKDFNRRGDPWYFRRVGDSLLGNIYDICSRLTYPDDLTIRMDYKVRMMRERAFCDYDFVVDRTFNNAPMDGLANAQKALAGKPLAEYEVHVSFLALGGDIAFVTINAEMFAEYALAVKSKSPYAYTMMAELTNGCLNYIPTSADFAKGGYEVRKPACYLENGAGDEILEDMLSMITR